jgi:membrane protein GlpM
MGREVSVDIVWKGVVGGLMTALIAWLAKRGSVLPGILPLFPTLTLIALYIVGSRGDEGGFRQACLAALKTVPAYLAFLLVVTVSARRMDYRLALLLGLAAWLAVVVAVFVGGRRG